MEAQRRQAETPLEAAANDPAAYQDATQQLHELNAKAASLREYLVSMDQRRQDNRIAARGVDKLPVSERNLWLSAGDVFLRMGRDDAKESMKRDDASIAEEIEVARRELQQVNAAMEGLAGSSSAHRVGANLQGMASSEVNQVLGGLPGRFPEE